MMGGVQYFTGQWLDMPRITAAAHAAGALCGFDLAHAVGNVPLDLHAWNVDFACWCTYKYLNSGPGAVAGAFVHERHVGDGTVPRFEGWWGHNAERRFLMEPEFDSMGTAEAWQMSNAPVFNMATASMSCTFWACNARASVASMVTARATSSLMASEREGSESNVNTSAPLAAKDKAIWWPYRPIPKTANREDLGIRDEV